MAATDESERLIHYLHDALQTLHSPTRLATSALLGLPVAQAYQKRKTTLTPTHALRNLLGELLNELSKEHPQLADLLRGRFWEGLTVDEMLARNRPEAQSPRRFQNKQKEALEHLSQIWQEASLRLQEDERRQRLLANLPEASYLSLFGAECWVEQALDTLCNPKGEAILAIKGNGGIGKTALADCIVRRLIAEGETFANLAWISAKQEYLQENGIHPLSTNTSGVSLVEIFEQLVQMLNLHEVSGRTIQQQIAALSPILHSQPYLIVIDNLESVCDFEQLTPLLAKLVRPTRFILTSRMTTRSMIPIHTLEIDELKKNEALQLVEHMAQQKHVEDYDPETIYDVVGGNPLAIILTVSQMKHIPAQQVLGQLCSHAGDSLYRYIYWNSWRLLEPTSKDLLFTIQRAGDQADWRWLSMGHADSLPQLQNAIEELFDFSLINLRQRKNGNQSYGIHRLTSTFLRTEVLGWT